MIIKPIWTDNRYRNIHYLVVCPKTGQALAVDPLDYKMCLAAAKESGWEITQVLNTHEHGDHTGGNTAMIEATGAKLLAHHQASRHIAGIDRGLADGDVVRVGKTVELIVMDTPGHTMCHICLLSKSDRPSLFSGDTLFNAGAGNCRGGGDPVLLFHTFATQLSKLPNDTRVYPGHDYMANNLGFTLDREPDNETARAALHELKRPRDPYQPLVTTLAVEREINTFCRLTSETIIRTLHKSFPAMSADPTPQDVFLRLRELRNSW